MLYTRSIELHQQYQNCLLQNPNSAACPFTPMRFIYVMLPHDLSTFDLYNTYLHTCNPYIHTTLSLQRSHPVPSPQSICLPLSSHPTYFNRIMHLIVLSPLPRKAQPFHFSFTSLADFTQFKFMSIQPNLLINILASFSAQDPPSSVTRSKFFTMISGPRTTHTYTAEYECCVGRLPLGRRGRGHPHHLITPPHHQPSLTTPLQLPSLVEDKLGPVQVCVKCNQSKYMYVLTYTDIHGDHSDP